MMRCCAVAVITLAAMLTAGPAGASDRHPHRNGDTDAVGLVAGAVIAGGLVALLGGKNRPTDQPADVTTVPTAAENDAANFCADAAERSMIEDGREARVERIASVTPREKGGYTVKGDIRVADPGDGYRMRFSCSVKGTNVQRMTLSI